MVYKRPTDFIPRKPNRTNDIGDDPCLEDLLSMLPDEEAVKSPNESMFLDSLNTDSTTSVGRWASSSSLDYYEDEVLIAKKALKQRVRFSIFEVREDVVYVGDNPSCKDGCPLSLDWEHGEVERRNVDSHEAMKNENTSSKLKSLSLFDRERRLPKQSDECPLPLHNAQT
mmetsp:Transcript_1002/g.1313  ORF Transcript_1002/g.1313 Transcript_1002/m.1313 type:complete len:170 (-) Transcript_1002:80-589(-)|eukprot:CAMPEP_0198140172 /NCGR_PEP_ID=MMETSP1443-20131203/3384_1 /TAXON_ID=186043 /ORGANISM="Entomoneis sp., Strain CCMP2396" /LENGTH=169 /DNA_ID=CAMNT_0043802519 /DNA_START=211 /DNA_END=720 /DNA_ORIENTATION=+